jgi:ferrous iron transport protein B
MTKLMTLFPPFVNDIHLPPLLLHILETELSKSLHIALLGNPNSGKSSLFNALTGLNQKVGNFPGVTVEKKVGECSLEGKTKADVLDLPGSYSLYPRRADEWVAYKAIMDPNNSFPVDLIVVIVDASNLRRNLLYASQVADLQKPVVVALTMMDLVEQKGMKIDVAKLSAELNLPVVIINPRKNEGISALKGEILRVAGQTEVHPAFVPVGEMSQEPVNALKMLFPDLSEYSAVHYLINHEQMSFSDSLQDKIEGIEKSSQFNHTKVQADEILRRYARISKILDDTVSEEPVHRPKSLPERFDEILLHRVWGYAIMFAVLFFLFQSIFWAAEYPMNAIEWAFGAVGNWLSSILQPGWFTDLLINGFLAGLSGILVFVPQIMILFGLITFLEDTGYMARISFLTDKIMRKVGLNGKSVMPMISSLACAVPAIMSARNIENRKERLLTIMVTPLMSCSARLPVYTILIALVIPKQTVLGVLSLQGLVMMGLYLLGFVMAMAVSYVMKWFIRMEEKSFFILELPLYRPPRWKNIFVTMFQKAKIFVFDAGKVIMVISLLLWALSSYGPDGKISAPATTEQVSKADNSRLKLENSFAGIAGKWIEPAIKPLGFDWKIGIALITSFAAREVFVGTMATLYAVEQGADENNPTLRQKMSAATKPDGTKVYTLATGVSLMIFYVLAMQCMSTLAVVKRETGTWKWPIIQAVYMTGLAYLLSLLAYQLLK